jgi:hypothetical protein
MAKPINAIHDSRPDVCLLPTRIARPPVDGFAAVHTTLDMKPPLARTSWLPQLQKYQCGLEETIQHELLPFPHRL